jgi:hypothetical protein
MVKHLEDHATFHPEEVLDQVISLGVDLTNIKQWYSTILQRDGAKTKSVAR